MAVDKYKLIYDKICQDIISGKYPPGSQLPTEQELSEKFNTSRPPIARALNDLVKNGLIVRQQGKGTFVKKSSQVRGQTLGILVPEMWAAAKNATRFPSPYAPLISCMTNSASQFGYALILTDAPGENTRFLSHTREVCEQLIHLHVKGVFFMPITAQDKAINHEIANAFRDAGIAVTLLNHDLDDNFNRSIFDCVSMNNEIAAFELTEHLIKLGCQKIDFVMSTTGSSTVRNRLSGYQKALQYYNIPVENARIHQIESDPFYMIDEEVETKVPSKLIKSLDTEALVCVNDGIAALLMKHLISSGKRIPQDIRIVGFDDLPFVSYLPSPLTTVRQPLRSLGDEAVRTMMSRIENPDGPSRDVMVTAEVVIRESCGAKLKASK